MHVTKSPNDWVSIPKPALINPAFGEGRQSPLNIENLISCRQRTSSASVGRANITVHRDSDGIGRGLWWCRHHIVTAPRQRIKDVRRDTRFDGNFIRLPLMMQTRRADCLVDRHLEIDCVHNHLQYRRNNTAAAGGAGDKDRPAVLQHDGRSH